MSKFKVKLICGFRKDQEYSIDAEESHKAYYLFLNPEKRGVFGNGIALIGKDIQRIEPDYHGTMGWNESYKLGPEDWEELKTKGIDHELKNVLNTAKELALTLPPEKMNLPLSQLQQLPEHKESNLLEGWIK
jgi:hypothetical protein